jgi:hypothetical protein
VIDGSTGFLVDDELAWRPQSVAGSSRATATRGCGLRRRPCTMTLMKRDDERHEYRLLRGQLDALEEGIESTRRALDHATRAHYEDFFSEARARARPEDIAAGEGLTLRDGSTVVIRPAKPADTSLVREGYEHLSAVTRYQKFLFDRAPTASDAEAVIPTATTMRSALSTRRAEPVSGSYATCGIETIHRSPRPP